MKTRMVIKEAEPKVYEAMFAAEKHLSSFAIDPKIELLIKIRVSQINGCAYCLSSHCQEARELGESQQRLDTLAAWWETPFFNEKGQIALRLAEEVTQIAKHGVSDSVYEKAIALLGERQVAQLILSILTINSWNRIAIATHMVAEKRSSN